MPGPRKRSEIRDIPKIEQPLPFFSLAGRYNQNDGTSGSKAIEKLVTADQF